MENNGNIYSCGHSDDIVAYIYNEIESDDRMKFETHLAGCMSCTDEFAAVSDARFSVFEWHKEEFTHLPTPEFSIPYRAKATTEPGYFAALGEMIRSAGWAVQFAAALVLCVGVAFVMFTLIASNDAEIAQVEVENSPVEADRALQGDAAVLIAGRIDNSGRPESENIRLGTGSENVPFVERLVAKPVSQKARKHRTVRATSPMMGKVPVLSSFEENEDRSLRLADLLDEVGG